MSKALLTRSRVRFSASSRRAIGIAIVPDDLLLTLTILATAPRSQLLAPMPVRVTTCGPTRTRLVRNDNTLSAGTPIENTISRTPYAIAPDQHWPLIPARTLNATTTATTPTNIPTATHGMRKFLALGRITTVCGSASVADGPT